jgi:hypothetical protein
MAIKKVEMDMEAGVEGADAPPSTPIKKLAYLVNGDLKGLINGVMVTFKRGDHMPEDMAKSIPTLPSLVAAGSLKEVYI